MLSDFYAKIVGCHRLRPVIVVDSLCFLLTLGLLPANDDVLMNRCLWSINQFWLDDDDDDNDDGCCDDESVCLSVPSVTKFTLSPLYVLILLLLLFSLFVLQNCMALMSLTRC